MSETSNYMVEFCDPVQMTELCGHVLNVHNSVLIKFAGSTSNLTFFSCHQNKTLSDRNSVTIKYCLNLISRAPHLFFCLGTETQPATLIFQGDDRPADIYSASWQRKKNYKSVCLLPDFYYVNNNGYTWFLDKGIPDWSSRKLEFFWRGSTTGGFNITPESLDALPRYRLCKIAKARAPLTNVGFYNVVQAADHGSQQRIEERLRAEELFLPATEMRDYAERKYIIQVDGNGNSWELVRKLRLGCCLLLAESDWQLWHDRFIFPWEHFVPIKHDFSDLNDIIDWCLTHDDKAQKIAENGRAYGQSAERILSVIINFGTHPGLLVSGLFCLGCG